MFYLHSVQNNFGTQIKRCFKLIQFHLVQQRLLKNMYIKVKLYILLHILAEYAVGTKQAAS